MNDLLAKHIIRACTTQILQKHFGLITTLFINGLIPFSALLGNAISNDGDALFPAIAIDPKVALLATTYSAIPAFILAYSIYFLFPNLGGLG